MAILRAEESAGAFMTGRGRTFLITFVVPVGLFFGLHALAAYWYSSDLDGIPDEGPVPAALLPWFLYTYRSGGSVWTSAIRFRTWSAACGGYLVPGIVAIALARGTRGIVFAVVVVLALIAFAIATIPNPPPPSEYIGYFTFATVEAGRRWICVLGASGLFVGLGIHFSLCAVRTRQKNGRPRLAGDLSGK